MRKAFRIFNVLSRDTKDKAEAASAVEGTAAVAIDTAPLAHGHDLYSTEGSIGMKVVAEPTDAVVEYVQISAIYCGDY
jgi:hypothetical protein